MEPRPLWWTVFGRVIDNFGDVGVCWRLSALLAARGDRVRLVLDDPSALAWMAPGGAPGVEVMRWPGPPPQAGCGDVVVEAFGCDPPPAFVEAMRAAARAPVWINLEHLSAEEWVEGCHALPSPHPRYAPLTRHFFFPGFTPRTGGLLRERQLLPRRRAFEQDPDAARRLWRACGHPPPPAGALRVSLFAYPAAPVAALLDALAASTRPVWLAVPEGAAARALESWLAARPAASTGALSAAVIPFLHQDRYDELLWACDVNFVRGEDSFVRAQWAGRPFVWQPYATEDGAHRVKLAAFLARYTASMDGPTAAATTALWEAWNRGDGVGPAWRAFEAALPASGPQAAGWCARLATQPDLAAQLVDFADHIIA